MDETKVDLQDIKEELGLAKPKPKRIKKDVVGLATPVLQQTIPPTNTDITIDEEMDSFKRVLAMLKTTRECESLVVFILDSCTPWPNFTKMLVKDKKSYVEAGKVFRFHPNVMQWLLESDEMLQMELGFTPRERIQLAIAWLEKRIKDEISTKS